MPKYSDSEKELRKEAAKLRNRDFCARRNERNARYDAAEAELAKTPDALGVEKYLHELDAILARRAEAEREFSEKQASLVAQLAESRKQFEAEIDAARQQRDGCAYRLRMAREPIFKALDAEFSDIPHYQSAAGWRTLDEYLPKVKAGEKD